jgi:hypothetical protein
MTTRREFLTSVAGAGAGLALFPLPSQDLRSEDAGPVVNDIHSQLNPTRVDRIVSLTSEDDLRKALREARTSAKPVCIAGGATIFASTLCN